MSKVNEAEMDYQMTIFFRQTWQDDRLAYRHLTNRTMDKKNFAVDSSVLPKLWIPDLYFTDEKVSYKNFKFIRINYDSLAKNLILKFILKRFQVGPNRNVFQ